MYSLQLCQNGDRTSINKIIELETACFPQGAIRAWELAPFIELGWVLMATTGTGTDKVVVGALEAILSKNGDLYIYGVCVAKKHRKAGIAILLCNGIEHLYKAYLKKRNHEINSSCVEGSIFLFVAPGNSAAIALYKKCNFTEAGREIDYFGAGEDRLRLSKKIIS